MGRKPRNTRAWRPFKPTDANMLGKEVSGYESHNTSQITYFTDGTALKVEAELINDGEPVLSYQWGVWNG